MTPEERRLAATIALAHFGAQQDPQSDDDRDDKQKGGKR